MVGLGLTDCQFHRKGRPVTALPHGNPPDADDLAHARRHIGVHIPVVALTIRRGHQFAHILANNLGFAITEHGFGGGTEGQDFAMIVDDDHRVGYGRDNRPQQRFARFEVCRPTH